MRVVSSGTVSEYSYVKNLQGDITALLDSNGEKTAGYTYDSWGRCSMTSDSDLALATLNPFRYRGYFYDEETGFYYLKSRYYDPVVGRFLNADRLLSGLGGMSSSYNLYSYCFNNLLNFEDSEGTYPKCTRVKSASWHEGKKGHRMYSTSWYEGKDTIDLTEKLTDYMEENVATLKAFIDVSSIEAGMLYFYLNVKDDGALDIKYQDEWKFEDGKKYLFNGMELRFDDPRDREMIQYGYELYKHGG